LHDRSGREERRCPHAPESLLGIPRPERFGDGRLLYFDRKRWKKVERSLALVDRAEGARERLSRRGMRPERSGERPEERSIVEIPFALTIGPFDRGAILAVSFAMVPPRAIFAWSFDGWPIFSMALAVHMPGAVAIRLFDGGAIQSVSYPTPPPFL
jgi:hypothetical protein